MTPTDASFVVSARKYRPVTFAQVVGQEALTSLLENAIAKEKIPHAMLFCGPRGVGKTSCARIVAYRVNNITQEDPVETKQFLNIFELDAASHNSVDDIRELVDKVRIQPQKGQYKVYIIDEVHMLSTQAFNAFLKTLEEPPPHALFILATTEKHKVLPTVLSRCQIFHFKLLEASQIVAHIKNISEKEKVKIEEEVLYLIARKAEGSLREALTFYDMLVTCNTKKEIRAQEAYAQLDLAPDTLFLEISTLLYHKKCASALVKLDALMTQGMDIHHLIRSWCEVLRNVLFMRDENTKKILPLSETQQKEYEAVRKELGEVFVLKALQYLSDCERTLYTSRYTRLYLELTATKIGHIEQDEKKNATPTPANPPPPKKNSYTDSEQLQAMIEKYPALKEWVEELNLRPLL